MAVLRLKALRTAGRELTEEEENKLPGCQWAVNHQMANYCFFNYAAQFLDEENLPSDTEVAEAKRVLQLIEKLPGKVHFALKDNPGEAVKLRGKLLQVLKAGLSELAHGRGVIVTSEEVEVTPNEAAALLNVSRPFLLKLLEKGKIDYHLVGSHKRMLVNAVLEYRAKIRRKRRKVLHEATAADDELEMEAKE
jgi:excisionase family DNA binding protein